MKRSKKVKNNTCFFLVMLFIIGFIFFPVNAFSDDGDVIDYVPPEDPETEYTLQGYENQPEPLVSKSISDDIVSIAVAENGRGPQEVGREINFYPYDLGRYLGPDEAWCSEFVAWVYRVAGDPFTGGYEGGWLLRSSTQIRSWFQNNKRFINKSDPDWNSFIPVAGDYIRYDTSGGGHSGIVRYVEGSTLYTVEGNVSNLVRLRVINDWRNASNSIDGIGVRNSSETTPDPVQTPVPTTIPGDVNLDGQVNIIDALLIAQYYVGLVSSQVFDEGDADVNCNGVIDIVDALLVAQYYVGLLNSFPC